MSLFERKDFTSHAGVNLAWKIDCDALTDDDIQTLAWLITAELKFWFLGFRSVRGIPRGGLRLAAALEPYVDPTASIDLIVDDVLTTGTSMIEARKSDSEFGVVIFARGPCPEWVWPMFKFNA